MEFNKAFGFTPRGLSRIQSAIYIGVSVSKFDQLVSTGKFPAAKRIDGRKVWDRIELDAAFDDLSSPVENNEWDQVA